MSETIEENIHVDCDNCMHAFPIKLLNKVKIEEGEELLVCDNCMAEIEKLKNNTLLEEEVENE